MRLDYKTATKKDIKDFLVSKNITDKQKKDFYAASHPIVKEKVSKKVFDAEGKPVMYQVCDKDKKPKFDAEGKPVMRQKIEMVEKQGGKAERQFSIMEAKNWVVANYPDDVDNKPQGKVKEEDIFADWA